MGDDNPESARNAIWTTLHQGPRRRRARLSRGTAISVTALLLVSAGTLGLTRASAAAPETPVQTFARLNLLQWWTRPVFRTYSNIHEAPGYCVGNLGQECGMDYAMAVGNPIAAIAPGQIINIQDRRPTSLGFIIQVKTVSGHVWHYEHMFTSRVSVGEAIGVGQILGTSGGLTQSMQTDYYSSGPHIEVRYGVAYNPSPAQYGAVWGQNFIDPRPAIAAAASTAIGVSGGGGNTGGFTVGGAIGVKYAALGGAGGFLGAATTNELPTASGIGRYNHFANNGSIYWTPTTGAWSIHGAIQDKWAALGWEESFLGYPIQDEAGSADGVGRFSHLTGGSIYWTPRTGAWSVHGAIAARWAAAGSETGALGYPISDEFAIPGGRQSNFEHGSITWNATTGATTVR